LAGDFLEQGFFFAPKGWPAMAPDKIPDGPGTAPNDFLVHVKKRPAESGGQASAHGGFAGPAIPDQVDVHDLASPVWHRRLRVTPSPCPGSAGKSKGRP
jgi:hypothetical protein